MLLSGPSPAISDLSLVDGAVDETSWWSVPLRFRARPNAAEVLNLFVKWQDTPLSVCLLTDTLLEGGETIVAVRAGCAPGDLVLSAIEFSSRAVVFRFGESTSPETRFVVYCELRLSSGDVRVVTFAVHVRDGSEANLPAAGPLPELRISDGTLVADDGMRTATVTVTLSAASELPVVADFATADETATAPDDYTSTSGTLTFAPGDTSKTITVSVRAAGIPEARQFRVDLSAPFGATIADGTGIVFIPAETATTIPVLTIAPAELEVQDDERVAVFTLSLSESTTAPVDVTFATVPDTATAGEDFTPLSGTATFAPGDITKAVSVGIRAHDEDDEEHFFLRLLTATNAEIFSRDGVAVLPAKVRQVLLLSVSDGVLATGESTRTATFTVSLSAASLETVTVRALTFPGTAITPWDYTPVDIGLTFAPGEITKTVTVAVRAWEHTAEEFFTLRLKEANGALIADAVGIVVIPASGSVAPGVPEVTISDGVLSVVSGSRIATLTVALSEATTIATSVNYTTVAGTAIAPGDYTAASGVLTFAIGETAKTILVEVRDTDQTDAKSFTVVLLSPSGMMITDGIGVVTLPAVALPALSVADAIVATVGSLRDANFVVTLSAAAASAITVAYATADGTATAPDDYTSTSGTLTFAPGETTKTVDVPVRLEDAEDEEAFMLVLSSPLGATIADGTGVATLPAAAAPVVPVISIGSITI